MAIKKSYCDGCELPMPEGCRHFHDGAKNCRLEPRTDATWKVGMALWDVLTDRRGIKHELLQCDPEMQVEIVETLGKTAIEAVKSEALKKI
jgi:hypothetical protein